MAENRPGVMMSTQGIDQLLGQLRAASAMAAGGVEAAGAPDGGADFSAMLKASIDQVNSAQADATNLAKAFEAGSPDVNLHEVMASLQKANLTFQAMVQVRNKLVNAYQEVMNMQV